MNQKLYQIAEGQTPYEVQNLNGHNVEVYLMDDFEGVKEEYVVKSGKFAVWTSLDGVNYRLFLENGYYDVVKDLYTPEVNQIWMDFWDKADNVSKRFSKMFVYPMMTVAVVLCIVSIFLGEKMGNAGTWVILGVLIAMFIGMIFVNTKTKKTIVAENAKSRDLVVELLGAEKFDALLDEQKKYMDSFFENLYPEDEEDSLDELDDEVDSEATPIVEIDETEATSEEVTELTDLKEETLEETKVEEEVIDLEEVDDASAVKDNK